MTVRIMFLGKLADLAGEGERTLPSPLDWKALLSALEPAVAAQVASEKVRIAVNGALVREKASLAATGGDEVALLPPVSGG